MTLNVDEALRYAGIPTKAPALLRKKTAEIAHRLCAEISPRYLYRAFFLRRSGEGVLLRESGVVLTGNMTERMLQGCDRVVLLACSLGAAFDAWLRREQSRDMSQAVLLDACGSAWVEAGCDQAEREIQALVPSSCLTERFSPGYGDLPLSVQTAICEALDAERKLGLTVSESLLLNPVKSVTAVIGISDRPQAARGKGCERCSFRAACKMRKGGDDSDV